jgi:hypothetical protein
MEGKTRSDKIGQQKFIYFNHGIMKDSVWVAKQVPNFLGPKLALAEECHFAVLCHNKLQWSHSLIFVTSRTLGVQ